jgi:hypothetical protein
MKSAPIDWDQLLEAYPGKTAGEKIRHAKNGKTFGELAIELQVTLEALKTCFYKDCFPRERREHVSSCPRLNYAAALGRIIKEMSQEKGKSEGELRMWLNGTGQREFERRCEIEGISLFCCRRG